MTIKTQLSEKDFINVNFILLYNKLATKVITGVAIFILLVTLFSMAFEPRYSSSTQIIVPIAMLIWLPLLSYFAAKKNFALNKRISETIEYQMDKDMLFIKGESFSSQLTWDKLYKVTKTKNWILIWQTKQSANAIPRKDFWGGQIAELKSILETHRVTNNL